MDMTHFAPSEMDIRARKKHRSAHPNSQTQINALVRQAPDPFPTFEKLYVFATTIVS